MDKVGKNVYTDIQIVYFCWLDSQGRWTMFYMVNIVFLLCNKLWNLQSGLQPHTHVHTHACMQACTHISRTVVMTQSLQAVKFPDLFFCCFFLNLCFTAISRIFHLYQAYHSSKVGENRRTQGKTTWPSVSRTWLFHIWPERGSNHSSEKPNGLRVNSPIQ